MQQTQPLWVAPPRPATVLAAPGYPAPWQRGHASERIGRAFILAAGKAGADAVELGPELCTDALVTYAREHNLHPVARVPGAEEARLAADAGAESFHVESGCVNDPALLDTLERAAASVIVSGARHQHEKLALLQRSGVEVVLLCTHDELAERFRSAGVVSPGVCCSAGTLGCELTGATVPPAACGVLVAAFGASLVRQHLAIARHFGREDASRFLSQKEFREMVCNLRAAEKVLGRCAGPAPRPDGRSLVAGREIRRGEVIERDHFESAPSRMEGKVAKLSVGKGFAIMASQLVANVVIAIDFTVGADVSGDMVELLLGRLGRTRVADCMCAVLKGAEPQDVRRALAGRGVASHQLEENWLAAALSIAARHNADVIAWLPAENVLTDPALLDRMVIQHVKSAADYTICTDLPRGMGAYMISAPALRRIGTFTDGKADAATVHMLLTNRRIFRVQDVIIESNQRRADLDLTWHERKRGLFDRIVQTGSEEASELIDRASRMQCVIPRPSESEAAAPFCNYSFITSGDDGSLTV